MERHPAAILAADIVGYSALVSADEEATLHAYKGHFRALEPHVGLNGGRLFKKTGDGFLAEFPSAFDAIACAETMQRQMVERNAARGQSPEMQFRMGIHAGDVFDDDGDVLGDGVNIAARLEGLAPPGGIIVSARVYEDVAGKVDVSFTELGPQNLKNIARPVTAYSVQAAFATAPPIIQSRPDKPSVVVLAFDNLSSDAEQDYFAEGITEDIITSLSRVPWIFVVARNSSFSYKGLSVDVRRIGCELGVRYVLEGSVRRAGNRLRVTGQLIDAETGSHVWADRYDGKFDDIFDLQDQITEAVVASIAPGIRQAEIDRSAYKRPDTLGAYDHFLRAQALIYRFNFTEADDHLSKALSLSSEYPLASALRGWIRTLLWNPDTRPNKDRFDYAVQLAHEVLEASHVDLEAQAYAGYVLAFLSEDSEYGLSLVDRVIETSPNCVSAWGSSCLLHGLMGEAQVAQAHAREALRLNPNDPLNYRVYMGISLSQIAEENWRGLKETAQKMRAFHNTVTVFRLNELVAEMALGNAGRATELARIHMSREPDFSVSMFRDMRTRISIAKPEIYDAYYTMLAAAGIPD
ncbi:adenylate/guanylate cyclase domain-containing protein [Ruegeria sp. Ofav3-42]|uniref:adenylate/guanylate cyclase domain-containing protein n=1 Tax=Ruegeria sp. Ofav3-42 TaxID=2917759 RepID=UPI001EF7215F|nr:adenylate/guanylate cyclase domain-containing protein [Ruegeria sp. Ofav3-42]MCG7522505.1 adenylate cyclase [Ruegeria sp. Ofav3-42]